MQGKTLDHAPVSVWQKAQAFNFAIYRWTEAFPKHVLASAEAHARAVDRHHKHLLL